MIERDWITLAGLRAVAYLIPGRHRCGYVAVPKGHPLYGCEYSVPTPALTNAIDLARTPIGKRGPITLVCAPLQKTAEGAMSPELVFDVHGSLTYSEGPSDYPAPGQDLWWFGFDCGHAGDGSLDPKSFGGGPVRSQAYVEAECESLAEQIVTVCAKGAVV